MKYLFIFLIALIFSSCNSSEEEVKTKTSEEIKEVSPTTISYSNFESSLEIVDGLLEEELYALGYDSLELGLAIIQEERSNNKKILYWNGIRNSMIQLEFFTRDKIQNLMEICSSMLNKGAEGKWMIEDSEKGDISFQLKEYPKNIDSEITVQYMKDNELLFRSEMLDLRRRMTSYCISNDSLSLNSVNTIFQNEETEAEFEKELIISLSKLNSESQQKIVQRIITTLSIPFKVPQGNQLTKWVEYQFEGVSPDYAVTYFITLKTDIELLKGAVMDYLVSGLKS